MNTFSMLTLFLLRMLRNAFIVFMSSCRHYEGDKSKQENKQCLCFIMIMFTL